MCMKSRSPLVTRYMCGLKLYVLQILFLMKLCVFWTDLFRSYLLKLFVGSGFCPGHLEIQKVLSGPDPSSDFRYGSKTFWTNSGSGFLTNQLRIRNPSRYNINLLNLAQAEVSVLVDVLYRPELLFPAGPEARRKCENGGFIRRLITHTAALLEDKQDRLCVLILQTLRFASPSCQFFLLFIILMYGCRYCRTLV